MPITLNNNKINNYKQFSTKIRDGYVAIEPNGWKRPLDELYQNTDIAGSEVLCMEMRKKINDLQTAAKKVFDRHGKWTEVFRDMVQESGDGNSNEKLHILYTSRAGTEFEKKHKISAPQCGFPLQTKDGLFYPDTLVPFDTTKDRETAKKNWESNDLPLEYLSYYTRLVMYPSPQHVFRLFDPQGYGKFTIRLFGNDIDPKFSDKIVGTRLRSS